MTRLKTIGWLYLGLTILLVNANMSFAGEPCNSCSSATTVDALVGDPIYSDPTQFMAETKTQGFEVPDGYKMVSVPQPPRIACTEYPVPDKWMMVSTAPVVKYRPARVTAAEEAELKAYLEAGQ